MSGWGIAQSINEENNLSQILWAKQDAYQRQVHLYINGLARRGQLA
jgi:hypothetical protein